MARAIPRSRQRFAMAVALATRPPRSSSSLTSPGRRKRNQAYAPSSRPWKCKQRPFSASTTGANETSRLSASARRCNAIRSPTCPARSSCIAFPVPVSARPPWSISPPRRTPTRRYAKAFAQRYGRMASLPRPDGSHVPWYIVSMGERVRVDDAPVPEPIRSPPAPKA